MAVSARGRGPWKVCKSWASSWWAWPRLLACCSGRSLHLAQPSYAKTPHAETANMVRTKLLPPPGSLSTLSSHGHHFPLSSGLPKTRDLSFLCHFHVLLLMRLLPRLPPLSCFPHITHTCMSQTRTQVQGTVLTLPAEFAAGPEPRWEWSFSSNLTSKRPGNWSKKGKETYWSSLGLQSHLDATDRHLSCFPLKPFVSHMANLQWMCTKSSTKHIFTTIHLRILDEVIPHISYRLSLASL